MTVPGDSMNSSTSVADYQRLANMHRPKSEEEIAREVAKFNAGGLRPRDIAMAMRLDIGEVLALLELARGLSADACTRSSR